MRAGKEQKQTAVDLGIHPVTLSKWLRQDDIDIDNGRRPGRVSAPVDRCCRILGVARQNYYKHKRTPTTPRQLRLEWLTGLIRGVHVASRGTYGYRRVHAELTLGMGIQVCSRTVSILMTRARGSTDCPTGAGEAPAWRRHRR
ncbi:hypothetical protein GCM10010121_020010 [Streptomyces brasiliensis]|uniref:HTH-like domain-containing protein n=1 Tax=Streptomyces brasiliensis TaxID=1954 RepID=A0A917KD50_9ACTN|nr:hypothetical protein GCM10010121_020010 [Streptomyces brasiliensis]